MSELGAPARLGLLGVALVLLLGAGLGLGAVTGDVGSAAATSPVRPVPAGASAALPAPVTGLADRTLRLDADERFLPAGVVSRFAFTVRRQDGSAVTAFDVDRGLPMHLLLTDRTGTRFAHLRPRPDPTSGTWTTLVTLAPGSYRAVADFSVDGVRHALAVDLTAPGPVPALPLPVDDGTVRVGGLEVSLVRDGDRLSVRATRDGAPVGLRDLFGAGAGLTVFRAGDLAYVPARPVARTAFAADLRTPGSYRVFAELSPEGTPEGTVLSAAFTLVVPESGG